jgi:hypothetical protein
VNFEIHQRKKIIVYQCQFVNEILIFLFFPLQIKIQMVDYIETFDLNVHMHDGFDCDDVHVKLSNLLEDYKLVGSSILMPSQPSRSKCIVMPNDLDEEIEIAQEVLKAQLILNNKTWVLHYRLFFS